MATGLPHRRAMVRNFIARSGVYRGMRCVLPMLLCGLAATGQVAPHDPFDELTQKYWQAQSEGRLHEAAAGREEARRMLAEMPPESPAFGGRVQMVAQQYEAAGMPAKARAVVEGALARMAEANPARSMLLERLAGLWRADGNLLKSVACLEQSMAAQQAAEANTQQAGGSPYFTVGAKAAIPLRGRRMPYPGAIAAEQLARAYQELGRPAAAAALLEKMKAQVANDDQALASIYESQNQYEQAAATYRNMAARSADQAEAAGALQALANMYIQMGDFSQAAATLRDALAGVTASAKPEQRQQAVWIRQSLAGVLQQAGNTEGAEAILKQSLSEAETARDPNYFALLQNYANFLSQNKRGAEAESMLNDYQTSHPQMESWQGPNLLFSLANAARSAGRDEAADEYLRKAQEKQEEAMRAATPVQRLLVGPELQKAMQAVAQSKPEAALGMALSALETAPKAADRQQIAWTVPDIASQLAERGEPGKAEQLFQRLLEVAASWQDEDLQTLQNALQRYARFLVSQQPRWGEVPNAIDRFRSVLIAGSGPETGRVKEALQINLEFKNLGDHSGAVAAGEELLALEETLSGNTSQPYFEALSELASACENAGSTERALELRRRAVAVADVALARDYLQRGQARMRLADDLARLGQFDEAERLGVEAVAMGEKARPREPGAFTAELQELRRQKAAAKEK